MIRLLCAVLAASLSCAAASAQTFVNIRSQDASSTIRIPTPRAAWGIPCS